MTASSLLFGGLDLAAEAADTGIAILKEDQQHALLVLEQVETGATDQVIHEVAIRVTKLGVDVPMGWPSNFITHITGHHNHTLGQIPSSERAWRRSMVLRRTDVVVRERTGLTPLSVAADRIAYPALRWSAIEANLRSQNLDCPRDGQGKTAEVYPAAALKIWGLPFRGYKTAGAHSVREEILTGLEQKFPALQWNGYQQLCRANDDALDAVIAALMARDVWHQRTVKPTPEQLDHALTEGWIHLPDESAASI